MLEGLKVYGLYEILLLDYGAIPNVLHFILVDKLSIILKETSRRITVSTGDSCCTVGVLKNVRET